MSQEIKNYKVYRMSLTTLSPVFIGSGEELNKSMYVYNDNEIMIIDEKKLIKELLLRKGLYESFLNGCSSGDLNLTNFLEKNLHGYKDIDIYKYKITSYSNIKTNGKFNNINTFIKSSNGKPYIPGSSIKGAIRTAIIAGEIINNKSKYNNIFKDIISGRNRYNENDIVNNISNNFNIKNIFNKISVSDTNDIDINNLCICKRYDISTHLETGHELPIYMELLKPCLKFNFLLTLYSSFSINDLSKYFNNFYNDNINDNTLYTNYLSIINIFKDKSIKNPHNLYFNYNNMIPNIFIGGANGFLTKSIIYTIRKMKNDNNEIISKNQIIDYVKKYLDKKFAKIDKESKKWIPQHNHIKIDEKISPRTLRLVKYNDLYIALGMCNIKVEEELC